MTNLLLGLCCCSCLSFRHFWWYENVLWREDLERLGMSPAALELSLIAEREQCVSSLPYHDTEASLRIEEENEEEERFGADHSHGHHARGASSNHLSQLQFQLGEAPEPVRARSDGEFGYEDSAGAPIAPGAAAATALSSATAATSSSSSSSSTLPPAGPTFTSPPSSRFSEYPLCPSSSPGVRAHVFVASNDDITPSRSVASYLAASIELQEMKWGRGRAMMSLRVFPDVGHAEALFHADMRAEIMHAIQSMPSDREFKAKCKKDQQQRQAESQARNKQTRNACSTPM